MDLSKIGSFCRVKYNPILSANLALLEKSFFGSSKEGRNGPVRDSRNGFITGLFWENEGYFWKNEGYFWLSMGSKWYDCMAKSALLEPIPTLEGVKIGPYFVANCKVNHSALSARSLKRHSFETSLHHEVKSSAIWDVHSYGASSQEVLP